MEATDAVQVLFHVLAGVGLFFIGVGVLWFVTVYKEFQAEEKSRLGGLATQTAQ